MKPVLKIAFLEMKVTENAAYECCMIYLCYICCKWSNDFQCGMGHLWGFFKPRLQIMSSKTKSIQIICFFAITRLLEMT